MPHNLIKGFNAFRTNPINYHEDGESGRIQTLLRNGQDPQYLIIGCTDSRVAPEVVLNLPPGTCFSHRPMGALVQPYDSKLGSSKEFNAKVKFALEANNVKEIIIMGHTHCGAIKALVGKTDDPDISLWVNVAKEAFNNAVNNVSKDSAPNHNTALLRETERQSIILSIRNLMTYPSVQRALENDAVKVNGWLFEMDGGNILELNQETGAFECLTSYNPIEKGNSPEANDNSGEALTLTT